jgi:hypothetical protein
MGFNTITTADAASFMTRPGMATALRVERNDVTDCFNRSYLNRKIVNHRQS